MNETTCHDSEKTFSTTILHVLSIQGDKNELQRLFLTAGSSLEFPDSSGKTCLTYSVLGDRPDCLEFLLKQGACVNAADASGRTAIHWAALKGHFQCCKILLNHGADRQLKDMKGRTALHLAASGRCSKCVGLFLKMVVPGEVDGQDLDKRTPLHLCAMKGIENHVRLLIKYNANVGIPDFEGKTPVHWAASCSKNSSANCVKILLDYAPSVVNWQDYEGRTALHLAVADGCKETVDVLSSAEKSNINSMDNEFRTPLHWAGVLGLPEIVQLLLDNSADASSSDANGATPLHYAAQNNFSNTVDVFLSHSKCANERDNDGRNALLWAAAKGADDVIRIMHKIKSDLGSTDKTGATALHMAALNGHVDTVLLLLQLEMPVDVKDFAGQTPLFYASEMGRGDVVQIFLENNAKVDCLDSEGKNSFHWAASGGHTHICHLLLKRGLDVNCIDYYGRTPLQCAAFAGYVDCVASLIENGADVNHCDNQGMTAIHWASSRGQYETVKMLLDYDAVVNVVAHTDNSYTPLDLALIGDHCEIARILIDKGAVSVDRIEEVASIKIQAAYRGYRIRKRFSGTWDLLLMHERLKLSAAQRRKSEIDSLDNSTEEELGLNSDSEEEESFTNFTHLNSCGIKLNRKKFPGETPPKKSVEIVKTNCLNVVAEIDLPPRPNTSETMRTKKYFNVLPWLRSKHKENDQNSQRLKAAIIIQRAWKRSRKRKLINGRSNISTKNVGLINSFPTPKMSKEEFRHKRGSSFPWGRFPSDFSYNLQKIN